MNVLMRLTSMTEPISWHLASLFHARGVCYGDYSIQHNSNANSDDSVEIISVKCQKATTVIVFVIKHVYLSRPIVHLHTVMIA